MIYSNPNMFPPPAHLAMQLTYRDVWLDFFISRQNLISQLTSGKSKRLGLPGLSF